MQQLDYIINIINAKRRKMRRVIILFLLITLTSLNASALTDLAYKEYKKHHYKKAFRLYKEASDKDKDKLSVVKATYNLGIFYYKGIGVKKDLFEAIVYFDVAVMIKEMKASYVIGDVVCSIPYEKADATTKKIIKIADRAEKYLKKIRKYCKKHPKECEPKKVYHY